MASDVPGKRSGVGADSVLQQLTQERSVSTPGQAPALTRSSFTVLVVDDQPALLYATARMLQRAGYKTLEASLGEEAIALAPGASAVVLDVNLPDVHGIEVCGVLKSGQTTARIPVVLTSAVYVDELHRGAGLASGADAYLIAPLSPEELAATLDRLLLPAA
ncbi:MAG: response regulator transcription factor [Ramlibacter sp.]